jgi:flagellar basal body-associated protein FliL
MWIIIIVCIVLVVVVWLAYEMIMAPIMPDDYGLTDEEIKEDNELTKNNKKNGSRN